MRNGDDEAREAKRSQRIGQVVEALGSAWLCGSLERGVLKDVRLRLPTEADPGVLLVLRATSAAGSHVAFVGGPDAGSVLLAWAERARKERVRWREDKPWSG